MSTNYALPVSAADEKRAKLFYDIVCWGGLLIVLLPVGIANLILGYILGDSPCTMCWGQRQEMAYIGVIALMMVRYGFKPKYLGMMLVMAATGLYMSFRHLGNHAARDVGQGFGLDIFGIHTQMWAEIVFWCVVMLFGIAVFFAPRVDALISEMKGKPFRPLTTFYKVSFWIVAAIIGSNTFQALWSTGVPPFWGQGDPVRFSMNPKYVVWSDASWHGMWNGINFLGKRDVKDPDFAYKPNSEKLGIKFAHDANNAPVAIDGMMSIKESRKIQGVSKNVNMFSSVRGDYYIGSKYDFWKLDNNLNVVEHAQYDPWFCANVLDVVGVTAFKEDAFVLMGMNKSIIRARWNDKADEVKSYANFTEGANRIEHVGGLGRGRIDTERAKFSYIHSSATDGKYVFTATVPDNKNKKKFVISKALMADWTLSAEFQPAAALKDKRSLGELYVTGMVYEDGKLYAVSKNHNVLVVIDIAREEVTQAWGLPSSLTDIRGLVKKGNTFEVVDHNNVVTLAMP